jgi:phospholipase C
MLPPGPSTLIQHIVLIVLENRSFDHLAGWTETPNGQIQNYTIGTGGNCDTFALNGTMQPPDPPCPANYPNPLPDYIGTGSGGDPGHGISEMATFWNGGDNKGWLLNNWITGAPENTSHYAIGYYQEDSTNLPFLWSLLKNTNPNFRSVLVHRYFSSMIAQTNPNRMYTSTTLLDSEMLSMEVYLRMGITRFHWDSVCPRSSSRPTARRRTPWMSASPTSIAQR